LPAPGNALEFRNEMAGPAIDRLAGKGAGQRAVGRIHLRDYRISDRQRLIHAGHVNGKIFREPGIEEQTFANRILRGRNVSISFKLRRFSRATTGQQYDRAVAGQPQKT
jgi:hypothetical protein